MPPTAGGVPALWQLYFRVPSIAEGKAAVEAHGGTIDLRSTPGKETVFTIRLPLDQGVTTAPSGTPEA